MGVTVEVLYDHPGYDQLGQHVGRIRKGDKVSVQFRAWYKRKESEKKGFLSRFRKPQQEFEDTYHMTKPRHFVVGDGSMIRGLEEGVQEMVFGQCSRMSITSDYAYGDAEHRGAVARVPPNSDIVMEVFLYRVLRDDVWHRRQKLKTDSTVPFGALSANYTF